ncbi:MAG: aldehyde dehydrogenase [Pseudomonadota bacterium]
MADSKGVSDLTRDKFYIGGQWVKPASDKRFTLINPSNEDVLGTVPEAIEADIDRAVAAARQAFDDPNGWATWSPAKRAEAMTRFSDALKKRMGDLAQAVSLQNGMPIGLSTQFEAGFPIGLLDFYTQLAANLPGEEVRPSQMGKETLVSRAPIGVVAAIVPWNFPVVLAMMKIAPAMAAGCTMVIKPSPGTVLDSYVLADAAAEAQLPPGVLNWVAADRAAGAYLVSHPGVDKVAFTGSTTAGRAIGRVCGELLRPVTLELGGKSAAIVLEDVDLNVLAQGLPMASLLNGGQACFSSTRILVPNSRYDQVVEAIAAVAKGLVVGDAMAETTHIGPMASSLHRDRVEGYIAKGRSEGKLIAGGGRPKDSPRGWFVEPTVFIDVDNSATIAREEIFGPVLTVIRYGDEAEAIRIANDSPYGLGGSVWSTDPDRAKRVAHRVRTGTIGINGYVPAIGSPFGGVKASGLGRELGPETIGSYQQLKSTYVMG